MYPYQDPKRSVLERTEDLLSRMTLEEKLVQMRLYRPDGNALKNIPYDTSDLEKNAHRMGNIYSGSRIPAENLRIIQDCIMSHNRWGIPAAVHSESLHGLMADNGTSFPQSIGLGATFNAELVGEIATQIGKEAHANGVTMTYAPNVDLSRDPRWGRVEENFGEDPYLTACMGVSYVKGLQSQGVSACVKHFIAHGSPENGLNLSPVHAGQREFYETMAVPFEKVIMDAKAEGVMPAYSELDGVPIHASKAHLTDLLRNKWGFEGQVVSDYGAIKMLHTFQKIAPDALTAGKLALQAGVDVEAPTVFGFGPELEAAVRSGNVPEKYIDDAVRRILKHKFEKGLFENPYADVQAQKENRNAYALQLARRAAQESCVLLKNEGVLPLSSNVGKLALIGPNADNPQLGDYTATESIAHTVTIRKALEQRLGTERLLFARGCTMAGGTDAQLQEAVAAAKQAQVAILVLGDNSNFYGGIGWGEAEPDGTVAVTCGEGFDTHTLDLPGRQQELLEAVCATGTPVVLLLESGRPYAVCWAKEHVPAIMQIWYPGEQGGYGVADVLFGDTDPSGRLPISFPRSAGHIPAYYNHKVSARGFYKKPGTAQKPGRDYVFDSPAALFSFGAGLSYTTFEYANLTMPETAGVGEQVEVSVTVKNTGLRQGCEVVQLYVTDQYCRITPFVRQLRGFKKLWLQPGEEKKVVFTLGFEDFAFINEDMEREVEPGDFTVTVGTKKTTITIK